MSGNVPQPPKSLLFANISEINPEESLSSFLHLADKYGSIYRIELLGASMVIISSQELVNAACDVNHFEKFVGSGQIQLRPLTGDGLFTSDNDTKNWKTAHNILAKAFGPVGIRDMFPAMTDIAEQLALKWERFGKDHRIDVAHDFTKLTLDTIGLCAFDYRFNSLYQEAMHPFIDSMVRLLIQAGVRGKRLPLQNSLMFRETRKFNEDVEFIHKLCDDIIQSRVENPTDSLDLLGLMLHGEDKETGARLSKENIRYQMVTFLIAGHETTSGLLSFVFYYLLRNPSTLLKAQAEVDAVTRGEPILFSHLKDFRYIDAVLKEALRMQPPVGLFSVKSKSKGTYTFQPSGYKIDSDESIGILVSRLHMDPEVWGSDADVFKPERMLDGGFEKLPPNSWKPFGNGPRACLGRTFAWQEATLVIARLLQKFNFEMADPDYTLKIKHTLTIKPLDFYMKARLRTVSPSNRVGQTNSSSPERVTKETASVAKKSETNIASSKASTKLKILFASNSGSCESFAQQLASTAAMHNVLATVQTLDSAVGCLPTLDPVAILCPSYEGEAADNGRQFLSWLLGLSGDNLLQNVKYAVLGAGHEDWVETYQKVPKLIDQKMQELGAVRILPRGIANAAGDFFGDFEDWMEKFWSLFPSLNGSSPPSIITALDAATGSGTDVTDLNKAIGLQVEIIDERRATKLGHTHFGMGVVLQNSPLTLDVLKCGSLPKRHIEIKLPEGLTYRSGDYLAVMPVNPIRDVKRVLNRFRIPIDSSVLIKSPVRTFLPTNPLTVHTLLGGYVELSQPATRRNIESLVAIAPSAVKPTLERVLDPETYQTEILRKRVSVLDILELHPTIDIPFALYLDMLPPMRIRQYSISSSPLWDPAHVTLTVDVLIAPALSGSVPKLGVASSYLAHTIPGDLISCVIKPSSASFHLPSDPAIPIVMVAAGSGISPMRGFIQERASMAAVGRKVGRAILYYGCRDSEEDYIYKDELEKWEKWGAVEVRPCFSRPSKAHNAGPKYVHERMWLERNELREFIKAEGRMYVCGSATKLAKSVEDTCLKIYMEGHGCGESEAKSWFESVKGSRYATDVFG